MSDSLLQLIVLFFVIFDPFASFVVFFVATNKMKPAERTKTALMGVGVAAAVSLAVLFLGQKLLEVFSTKLTDFEVAGGIILILLGIKMALGDSLMHVDKMEGDSTAAVAALIGTPLLTGPAVITAILISTHNNGIALTGLSILIVLVFTLVLFLNAALVHKKMGKPVVQVISTILGLITLAWGVKYIRLGLGI